MSNNKEPWYKHPDENRILAVIYNDNTEKVLVISKVEITRVNHNLSSVITTSHIKYNMVGKIYVCHADITRYFITESINNKRDTLREVGYPPRLLREKSIEEIHDILSDARFKEASIEEIMFDLNK